VGWALGCADAG